MTRESKTLAFSPTGRSSIRGYFQSNRYTSQVTDLFIRDRVNLWVFVLFVIASVFPLWVGSSYGGGFQPQIGVLIALLLATASIIVLIPYFAYVFTFLRPTNIIDAIRSRVRACVITFAIT